MKKYVFGFATLLAVSLLMNGSVFGLGSGELILDSLSLKMRTDDPTTEPGEGKIYYKDAVAGSNDANTVLLLHMDGTGSSFTDSSPSQHTGITATGVAQTATPANTNLSDGVNVAFFDGTGDYLEIADSADWDLSSSDGTIDLWLYPTSWTGNARLSHSKYILSQKSNAGVELYLYLVNNNGTLKLCVGGGSSCIVSSSSAVTLNTWQHIAVVKNGSTTTLYLGGKSVGSSASLTWSNWPIPLRVGGATHQGKRGDVTGYIDEVRISKGVARWTSNFDAQLPTNNYGYSSDEGLYFRYESNGAVVPID